jgi:hypothetical protein
MSVVLLGSTSGSITLQEPAVAGTNTVNFGANTGVAILDANTPAFRNRIINGGCGINQRGSTVTTLNDATNFFFIDRFTGASLSDGAITGEQSTDAPAGFTNSIKYAVTTSDSSLSSTQYTRLYYQIEGLNIADLAWGSASAATVTLSFWTKSSVTGTFGGTIQNSARDRSYAFSYTINSANTWEQKSITIVGDTSGTWLKDNNVGMRIAFGLASGSNYQQTNANTWESTGVKFAPSSALNLLATNGATWFITGVQLEKGSTATSFDYRPYGTELALCQRYYEILTNDSNGFSIISGMLVATSSSYANWFFKQTKRSSPTVALVAGSSWTAVTPTITPSIDHVIFGGSNYFYNSGTANATGITASAEL